MKTVWKFPIGNQVVMPKGAQIVHVAEQDGTVGPVVTMWALVDPEAPAETRRFAELGTGHEIPDEHEHVGTWQSGPFVWHLFEHRPKARQ